MVSLVTDQLQSNAILQTHAMKVKAVCFILNILGISHFMDSDYVRYILYFTSLYMEKYISLNNVFFINYLVQIFQRLHYVKPIET